MIWCKGEILEIYSSNNQVEAILVHYSQWHKMYDEVIYFPSIRLAPLGYFTNRTDIACYVLKELDNNLRGMVSILRDRNDHRADNNTSHTEYENDFSEGNSQQNEAN